MKKIQFTTEIKAGVDTVFDLMLGISNKSTYELWTAMFNPTSTYQGNWNRGSKILFVGFDEKGEKNGMVSEIVENIPNIRVSIRHYGLVNKNIEITTGPEVEKWANSMEIYSFEESYGSTFLTIELDTTEEFLDYMNEFYPKALQKLKEICESYMK